MYYYTKDYRLGSGRDVVRKTRGRDWVIDWPFPSADVRSIGRAGGHIQYTDLHVGDRSLRKDLQHHARIYLTIR